MADPSAIFSLIGYANSKLLDAAFAAAFKKSLWSKLIKVAESWAEDLPDEMTLSAGRAQLAPNEPEHALEDRPKMRSLHQKISSRTPTNHQDWLSALSEQWLFVHDKHLIEGGYAPFFQIEFDEVLPHLEALSILLDRVFYTDDDVSKQSIREIRQILMETTSSPMDEETPVTISGQPIVSDSSGIIDPAIETEILNFLDFRTLPRFGARDKAVLFATQLTQGALAHGSQTARARGLGWCVRILSFGETRPEAERLMSLCDQLPICDETEVGRAILRSEDASPALLRRLNEIGSPVAYSAALISLVNTQNVDRCLDWLQATPIEFDQLNVDAQIRLLFLLIMKDRWDVAKTLFGTLPTQHWQSAPVLSFVGAIIHTAQAAPKEERSALCSGVPFSPEHFTLAEDAEAKANIKTAIEMLERSAPGLKAAGFAQHGSEAHAMGLWLKIRAREAHQKSLEDLSRCLADPETGHVYADLAFRFCEDVSKEDVLEIVAQQEARFGELDVHAAKAQIAVALSGNDQNYIANEIKRLRPKLQRIIAPLALANLEITAFCLSGRLDEAQDVFDNLSPCPPPAARRFERMLAEARGEDPIVLRHAAYEETGLASDLDLLIEALAERGVSPLLAKHLRTLFDATKTNQNAARYISALEQLDRFDDVDAFLDENEALVLGDERLAQRRALSLYRRGRFDALQKHLDQFRSDADSEFYRDLYVSSCVETGKWDRLSAFAQNELTEAENRSAIELMKAAHLISHSDRALSKRLAYASVSADGDNPNILANGYQLATGAGWEDESPVRDWFERAIELSDEESGPFWKADLADLVDDAPRWRDHARGVWDSMHKAERSIAIAADGLNRRLTSMTLATALQNRKLEDTRGWTGVPIHHGGRQFKLHNGIERLSVDLTSFLVLSDIGALEHLYDIADRLVIPHGLMTQLYESVQNATFHQPSLVEDARRLLDLSRRGAMSATSQSGASQAWLVQEIGSKLADLVSACSDHRIAGNSAFVIHPGRIKKAASLGRQVADLRDQRDIVIGCLPIIHLLHQSGRLTRGERDQALEDLILRGDQEPSQEVEVSNSSVLFLDGLALTYLHSMGMLEHLHAIGMTVFVSPSDLEDAELLVEFDENAENVLRALIKVQKFIADGLKTGKIETPKKVRSDQPRNESASFIANLEAPNVSDALLCDDRSLNVIGMLSNETSKVAILSTIEVIAFLKENSLISSEQHFDYEHRLRTGGYLFVPITVETLKHALSRSQVGDDGLIETAELLAIRNCINFASLSDWFQFYPEEPWLSTLFASVRVCLTDLWCSDEDLSIIEAKATWLTDLVDWRDWLRFRPFDPGEADTARAGQLWVYATQHYSIPNARVPYFLDWADRVLIAPADAGEPGVFNELIALARQTLERSQTEASDNE
ncbi:MAG: hypothetical protein AAFZ74_14285 [Pseudomonadota bacterium]